jgi:hypothetical protein
MKINLIYKSSGFLMNVGALGGQARRTTDRTDRCGEVWRARSFAKRSEESVQRGRVTAPSAGCGIVCPHRPGRSKIQENPYCYQGLAYVAFLFGERYALDKSPFRAMAPCELTIKA